jgi:hypothetical protein
LQERLKVEAQIRKIEKEDSKKLKLIARLAGVKVPTTVPSAIVDCKEALDPFDKDLQKDNDLEDN